MCSIQRLIGVYLALTCVAQSLLSAGPEIVVAPNAVNVTVVQGGTASTSLNIANSAVADANLDFTITDRETGRTPLKQTVRGVDLAPSEHDFTKIAAAAEFAPGRLLVRFAKGTRGAERETVLKSLAKGSRIVQGYNIIPGLCLIELPSDLSVEGALEIFNQSESIIYAEPDYVVRASATVPNDPRFDELWGMHNTGQTGGATDADIDAPEAWDVAVGNDTPIVAVIDTGVDYTHPDLSANMWTNDGEIPGNQIDDDGNGYIDDIYGYDFCNYDNDPMDDHGHGTHCSGTVGAVGDNNIGVAGVCWHVRIMALKYLSAGGYGYSSNAVYCVQYAVQMNADVLSNSWGGGGYNQSLKDAIDAAGAAGVVFAAAAGNDYGDNNDSHPHYPSSYASENIIAVMSTDHNDARSNFSNYGPTSVDIGAPGSDVLSCQPGGGYTVKSGTSMATPHVAGGCALLLSVNPTLTVQQIKNVLFSTVDPTLSGQCVAQGRMNIGAAINEVGAAWMSCFPERYTGLAPGSSTQVIVTFDSGELSPGSYTGELNISSNDLDTPNVILPAMMTIPRDKLSVTPASGFDSVGIQGGPFSPQAIDYTLINTDPSPIEWSFSSSEDWLTASPASGSLSTGESVNVTVRLTQPAYSLPVGSYDAIFAFQNVSSGAILSREASLLVDPIPPETIYYFSLDHSPGWVTQGQWQFGAPQGGGNSYGDPTSGRTGANVYGYNLAGNYTNRMPAYSLQTTALDCSNYSNVSLNFWRWLGMESSTYDDASIQVSNDGVNWTDVWAHNGGSFCDSSWEEYHYDISAVADEQSTVYIRWVIGPTDGSVVYPGWNIDDISILGYPLDDLGIFPSEEFTASGVEGGPFTPASITYTLTNRGDSSLNWIVSLPSWMTANTSYGYLPIGSSTTTRISINSQAGDLIPENYTDAITFINVHSGVRQERKATLNVEFDPSSGSTQWYFADGDTRRNVQTYILVNNPNIQAVNLTLTLYFEQREPLTLNAVAVPLSRYTFRLHDALPAEGVEHDGFGCRLTSDRPVFAERAIYRPEISLRNNIATTTFRTCATATVGARELLTEWFLAEGTSTISADGQPRETWIFIANPNEEDVVVQMEFLREGNTPVSLYRTVPAQRRVTFGAQDMAELTNMNFSTWVRSISGSGVVVDRTMVGSAHDLERQWSHASLGAGERSTEWHFGDGALVSGFDTFLTLANPGNRAALVNLRFLREHESPFSTRITVPPFARQTVITSAYPELVGRSFAIEAIVESGGPEIVAERPIFWRTEGYTHRSGASNTIGATHLDTIWFMPEGAVYGNSDFQCFICIGNPSSIDADVDVYFRLDRGEVVKTNRLLPAGRRATVSVGEQLRGMAGETISFSTMVHSANNVPIVADRSMYAATLPSEDRIPKFCGHASQALTLETQTAKRMLRNLRRQAKEP